MRESCGSLNARYLDARRILVVAPHPDDESLGCGGLIALLAARGASFHTVFVTDGGASHRGSRHWPRPRLAARREQEAIDALERLGVGTHRRSFLRLADADMPPPMSREWQAALLELETIVRTFNPDLVLLPWRRDPHCDHRDAWRLFHDAASAAGVRPLTLEYAIWLDEFGAPSDRPRLGEVEAVALDISDVVDRKRAAIGAHISQTTDLISDDPSGFRLTAETIVRLTGPHEEYWRPLHEAD